MISRRIGPISPARTRPEWSDGAVGTFAVSLDWFGLASSQRTFGIGITPNASVNMSVPHVAPPGKSQWHGTVEVVASLLALPESRAPEPARRARTMRR